MPPWIDAVPLLFLVLYLLLLYAGQDKQPKSGYSITPHLYAASMPRLFIPGGLAAPVGSLVDVPIAFDSGGTHVAAISFSLDYGHECLAFDPADQDKNGLPDALLFNAPAQFFPSVAVHAAEQHGRIDIILADYIPPLAALPDTSALVTIQFRIVCPVAPGLTQNAHVRFAAAPAVGFSDPAGRAIAGAAYDGTVQVIGALPDPSPTVIQTTTPPSPTPPVSPTPTPGGTIPPPQVALELTAWPERITPTDRSLFLILDYIVLMATGDATISATVPQAVQVDTTSSTPGWLCEAKLANNQCLFLLPKQTLHHSVSGRLFLTMKLNSPPGAGTQLDFVATLQTNDGLSSQTQHLVLPVLPADPPPPLSALSVDLVAETSEVIAGLDDSLVYTLTYTNTTGAALQGVEFHLILPTAGAVRSTEEVLLDWHCLLVTNRQSVCTLQVDMIEPGTRQQQFMLQLEQLSQLKDMAIFILAVYVTHNGKILSTSSSLVPVRQRLVDEFVMFLPLIARGQE